VIKNRLFPLKDSVTLKSVEIAINKLERIGLVSTYCDDGKPYIYLSTWNVHQSIRAKRSKYPAPNSDTKERESNCMQMQADESKCPRNPIQSESNPNPNLNPKGASFAPPTLEEVAAYCKERGGKVDPQRFIDFYASKGWMIGKNKMKDWKAAIRTWERDDATKPRKPSYQETAAEYRPQTGPDDSARLRELLDKQKAGG
jgi:hypothetical protein